METLNRMKPETSQTISQKNISKMLSRCSTVTGATRKIVSSVVHRLWKKKRLLIFAIQFITTICIALSTLVKRCYYSSLGWKIKLKPFHLSSLKTSLLKKIASQHFFSVFYLSSVNFKFTCVLFMHKMCIWVAQAGTQNNKKLSIVRYAKAHSSAIYFFLNASLMDLTDQSYTQWFLNILRDSAAIERWWGFF